MPAFQGVFDKEHAEEEVFQLIAYIQSLKSGKTPKRVEEFPPPTTPPPAEPEDAKR
jgi:hypothetical protein